MTFATRAGCRLYYELSGDPALAPLVLVRGLARSSRYWSAIMPALAARFRVLVLDNRGIGRSDVPPPPYSIRDMADDVVAVMDAAGIARAHVFGMSLGGMIAQQVAIAHGDRVDRLVLGCTTPGGKRAKQTSLAGRLALLRASLGSVDRQLALLVSDEAARTRPEIRAQWLANAAAEPVKLRGVIGQTMAALRHDAFDRLASIAHPTLVITGDDDVIIPPENSQLLAAQIPHAKLVVLARARHDFATDRPGDTSRAIVEFLGA